MSGSININVSGIACSITSAGISAPSYAFILSYLQAQYQAIYGSDVVLTSDTQDGQWLAILATAFNDVNAATIAAYNNQSPATAQGAGLSSVIKINGLTREVPTNSTMPVAIGGTFPTTITNGVVVDSNNYAWNLPATVDIPSGGTVTVTAICQTPGAIAAAPQTLRIQNPQRGWQTAANATGASQFGFLNSGGVKSFFGLGASEAQPPQIKVFEPEQPIPTDAPLPPKRNAALDARGPQAMADSPLRTQ